MESHSAAGPGAGLERDEAREALGIALDCLPHELKSVVLLHHFEGWSYRQIAAVAGCTERGVETRLYRARQILRDALAVRLHEPAPR